MFKIKSNLLSLFFLLLIQVIYINYIWGYNGIYPGPTIEAFKDIPVYVEWANNLPDKHFLPFDTTLHGTQDDPEVKTVVHLHGAKVAWESDDHPEAWYTAN